MSSQLRGRTRGSAGITGCSADQEKKKTVLSKKVLPRRWILRVWALLLAPLPCSRKQIEMRGFSGEEDGRLFNALMQRTGASCCASTTRRPGSSSSSSSALSSPPRSRGLHRSGRLPCEVLPAQAPCLSLPVPSTQEESDSTLLPPSSSPQYPCPSSSLSLDGYYSLS